MIAVLALDALDPDLVARFRAEGRLPTLDGMARRGAFGALRSTFPPVSVPAWSTFLCGVGPGRHGLFDFTRLEDGRLRFQHGGDRPLPTLLELADAAGRRCFSIGVPTTYPAPRLRTGAVLSGFDSPLSGRPDARGMHPLPLWRELRREGLDLRPTALPEGRKGRGWHRRAEREIHASIERRTTQALGLLRRGVWDLGLVHFQAADTAGHHFFRYHDAAGPRAPSRPHPERGRVLGDVYAALDAAVARLVAAFPGGTRVVVLSDHGMRAATASVVHLNRWLELEGFLSRRSRGRSRGVAGLAVLRRTALAYLPRELQSRLFRALRAGPVARIEGRLRTGSIDFERSAAFSEESPTLPGIWLLDPAREDELIARLRRWPAVTRVHRREDLYRGDLRERAPHLLLELRHSLVSTPIGYAGPPERTLPPDAWDGGRGAGMNGVHAPDGVLLASGPGVGMGTFDGAWIGDLAPTLLAILGVAVPDWMEGRALPLLAPEVPGDAGERSANAVAVRDATGARLSARDSSRIERRLRALGYLG